jgi:hypothetical protein
MSVHATCVFDISDVHLYIFSWKRVLNCDETQTVGIDGAIQLDDSYYYGNQFEFDIGQEADWCALAAGPS